MVAKKIIKPLVFIYTLANLLCVCVAEKGKQNGDEVPLSKRRKEKGSESPAEGQ